MNLDTALILEQKQICKKYGYKHLPSDLHLKVGISLGSERQQPIHGLRHPPYGDTTGWYIWWGDYSDASDFFKPLHVVHLLEWCPLILPDLGLPVGCRVLIAEDGKYVDIWETPYYWTCNVIYIYSKSAFGDDIFTFTPFASHNQ